MYLGACAGGRTTLSKLREIPLSGCPNPATPAIREPATQPLDKINEDDL